MKKFQINDMFHPIHNTYNIKKIGFEYALTKYKPLIMETTTQKNIMQGRYNF